MGWISGVEEKLRQPSRFTVTYSPLATVQIEWLRHNWGIGFMERAQDALSRDPSIHRTRRIRKWQGAYLQMGCGGWRIIFSVSHDQVRIEKIVPGYPDSLLLDERNGQIPDQEAQIAFKQLWPDEPKLASAHQAAER
jgi:hypothetical protein